MKNHAFGYIIVIIAIPNLQQRNNTSGWEPTFSRNSMGCGSEFSKQFRIGLPFHHWGFETTYFFWAFLYQPWIRQRVSPCLTIKKRGFWRCIPETPSEERESLHMVSLEGIGESFESFARYVEILRDPLCANLVGVKTRDFPVDFPKNTNPYQSIEWCLQRNSAVFFFLMIPESFSWWATCAFIMQRISQKPGVSPQELGTNHLEQSHRNLSVVPQVVNHIYQKKHHGLIHIKPGSPHHNQPTL